jgi:BirA family biotin operon repressor/biotin-[acetyl-CoA-carboxylase] ligase
VADVCGDAAQIKWPNDVLLDGRKVAGILVEARLQQGWAVLGIGVNVAVRVEDLPPDLRGRAGTLAARPRTASPCSPSCSRRSTRRSGSEAGALLGRWRARDGLRGREVAWHAGHGVAAGIDDAGRLLVRLEDGRQATLDAGEVHLAAGGT